MLATRKAYEAGLALLDRYEIKLVAPTPEIEQRHDRLKRDVELLGQAATLRIRAARKVQGAATRKREGARRLFEACNEIRRRVKARYRGPKYAQLRGCFGEGVPVSDTKPGMVITLAQLILRSAENQRAELERAGVHLASIRRLTRLLVELIDAKVELPSFRADQRRLVGELAQAAKRICQLTEGE